MKHMTLNVDLDLSANSDTWCNAEHLCQISLKSQTCTSWRPWLHTFYRPLSTSIHLTLLPLPTAPHSSTSP